MAYEMEDIRTAQEIFYYLLEYHELSEEDEERLYRAYPENAQVQNLVKSQGEAALNRLDYKISKYEEAVKTGELNWDEDDENCPRP